MQTKRIALTQLKPNPDNPRIIKDAAFKKLVQSIKDFPEMIEAREIVVNQDLVILGGNMRYRALKEAGVTEVPIKIVNWPEDRQREFVIKDNVSGGEWDYDALANQYDIEELDAWGLELPEMTDVQAEVEEDEAPEVSQEPPVSKLGEIYQLGRHKVMCGDSTDKANVDLLMNGEKADMVFTDPPYGIEVVSNTSVGGSGALRFGGKKGKVVASTKGFSEIIGDDTTDTARKCYEMCKELGISNFIIWGGNYFTDFLPPSMGWIVWYKKNTGNFADFEMAWTSYDKAARLYEFLWNGLSREGDRASELNKRVHPTQKPVGLTVKILNEYEANNILDLFLGSGSTLIACEQTDRTCYGMELDPKYCDVIRKRYWKFINNGDETGWQEGTPVIQ